MQKNNKYIVCFLRVRQIDTPKCHRSPLFSGKGLHLTANERHNQENIIGAINE